MVNYSNGKIYKVINDINGMIYIGSTTQPLARRMSEHRCRCKKLINNCYKKWGNIEDCKIYLIEYFKCNFKEELLKRERFYIENTLCINSTIPSRTDKETSLNYYYDNRDEICKKRREVYKLSPTIKCDCGGKYHISNKRNHIKTNKHISFINK